MSSNDPRYTAEEWREIQQQYREQPRRGVRTMFPDPLDECELGPFVPQGAFSSGRGRQEPQPQQRHAPHVEGWMNTLSAEDITKLEALMALRPDTVKWVAEKNPRELQKLDETVEFYASTRTAGKVLAWVIGAATSFVIGSIALAKAGIDAFAIFRGVGK